MSIGQHNYEEWMVAFMDGELNAEEVLEFNKFIDTNPDLKSELAAFEETQFTADETLVFENKKSLYKKGGAIVLVQKAWPLAAAIILMVAIWPFINTDKTVEPTVAKEDITEKKIEEKVVETNEVEEKEEHLLPTPKQVVLKQPDPPSHCPIISPTPPPIKNIPRTKKNLKIIKEEYVDVPDLPEIIQDKEIKELPKRITPIEQPKKEVVIQENETPDPLLAPSNKTNQTNENNNALVVIDEVTHPKLYQKLNTVVTEIENKIETIKELKRKPITVCIGKRKLFTINN